MSKEFIPIVSEIEMRGVFPEAVEYYCPEEYIECWEAELKGKPKKYKLKNPTGFCVPHWFYFVVLKDGKCNMVSGLFMTAWLMKQLYEDRLGDVNKHPKITKNAERAVVEFILSRNPDLKLKKDAQ